MASFLRDVLATQRYKAREETESEIRARFTRGEVTDSTGRRLDPDEPVPMGSDCWFYRRPPDEAAKVQCPSILYADEHLVVAIKPPGMATSPKGQHVVRSVVVQLRRATGNEELSPLHRLDLVTGGLVILSTRRQDRRFYQMCFAEGTITKRYCAIVLRSTSHPLQPLNPPQCINNRLQKTQGILQVQVVPGKPNATTVIEAVHPLSSPGKSWCRKHFGEVGTKPCYDVDLHPLTGKTHQLRRHLSDAGYPIIGDPLYPRIQPKEVASNSIALWATSISFIDPITGVPRRFSSPPPWRMASADAAVT